MKKINLMDKLKTDPFTIKPKDAKVKSRRAWGKKRSLKKKPTTEKKAAPKREIKTVVICGCGNHPINPKKDPYMQHNKWAAQFHPNQESGRTDIRNVKGIGATKPTPKARYDFSGEEYE